jgi:lipoprotein-anchoring transpeptidase ErfK/SrfK
MSIRTRVFRLAALLAACALLTLSAGFAWSVADDFGQLRVVPQGVTLDGRDLGGLTRSEAQAVIERAVVAPLLEPIEVDTGAANFMLDPENALTVDVDAMLEQAFRPHVTATVAERSYRRIMQTPVSVEVETLLETDGTAIEAWVADIASRVDSASVDATLTLVDDQVVTGASAEGRRLDREETARSIDQALLGGTKLVTARVEPVKPEVTEEDLGTWIKVDISERTAYLYSGFDLVKTYNVAVGTGGYPTPRGDWEITLKRYMPTWYNPAPNGWGKNMPKFIGPGPGNPLGTRAINLNASGIRFHGTTNNASVGTAASHGCMRMHRWDVEDLYERVEVGNRVLIVR